MENERKVGRVQSYFESQFKSLYLKEAYRVSGILLTHEVFPMNDEVREALDTAIAYYMIQKSVINLKQQTNNPIIEAARKIPVAGRIVKTADSILTASDVAAEKLKDKFAEQHSSLYANSETKAPLANVANYLSSLYLRCEEEDKDLEAEIRSKALHIRKLIT